MLKKKLNLTYFESLLLATHVLSISALHSQHRNIIDQNQAINQLSQTVLEQNQKLFEIQTSGVEPFSLKFAESTRGILSSALLNLSPKIIFGTVCVGAIFYGSSIMLAKISTIGFPMFKSLLVPLKFLPFIKEQRIIESINQGSMYKIVLDSDDGITDLAVRPAECHDYEPLSNFVTQVLLAREETNISAGGLSSSASSIAEPTGPLFHAI